MPCGHLLRQTKPPARLEWREGEKKKGGPHDDLGAKVTGEER